MTTKLKPISFTEVREFYDRNQPDGTWFDPSSMRFFKTKLPDVAYEHPSGGIYFVTQETNPSGEKAYTVRQQAHDGRIKTVGDFHSHKTRLKAIKAIEALS